MVDINPRSKEAAAALDDGIGRFGEEPAAAMASSRSGRMRKVVKYGHSEVDSAPKGSNFQRSAADAERLAGLKERFKAHKGYYPTGGQASSVKWLASRIAEMDSEKAGGGVVPVVEEDREKLSKELEREEKAEQKRLEKEAKEAQRQMVAEDQRKIREHKQREKEERMAEKLWSEADDLALAQAIGQVFYSRYGRQGSWPDVPGGMGTSRSHDSCRHRWNVIKSQPAVEAAVQAAAKEYDEILRKKAEGAGQVLVARGPLGPERSNSPRSSAAAHSSGEHRPSVRQSGGSACNRCKRLKRKCDGGLPCKACIEKNVGHECNYDHLAERPSPVNVPEPDRGVRDSCRICKGAVGICRKWNTPGHLVDPSRPTRDGSSSRGVVGGYDSGGLSQMTSPVQGADWTTDEDQRLRDAVTQMGTADWTRVAGFVGNSRAPQACRGRWRRLGAAGERRVAGVRAAGAQQAFVRLAGGFRWLGLTVPKTEDEKDDYWKTYWAQAAKKQEEEQREEQERIRKQQEEEKQKSQKPEIHEELRECPGSNLPYTKSEFEEEFGGLVEWEVAKKVPNPIHTVNDAQLSPFTDAIRKKAEVAKKIAARHAERIEAEKQRRLAAAAASSLEDDTAVHLSVPGNRAMGLEFGKYTCVEADGKRVNRVVVDGKVVDSPADKCGLALGLVLSHIEGESTNGDKLDEYMAGKRQVTGMPLLTLIQTLRITPRPMKLYFDGRVAVPKSLRHGAAAAAAVASNSDAASLVTSGTDVASTASSDVAPDAGGDSSGAGSGGGSDPSSDSTAPDSGALSTSPRSGDSSTNDTGKTGSADGTGAAAKEETGGTDCPGEQNDAANLNADRVTVRAIFGKTVERLEDDLTKLTVAFADDECAEYLAAEVRTTTAEQLADAGAPNLTLSDINRNWGEEEDKRLWLAVAKYGNHESNWGIVSAAIGGHRSSFSCKSRWARLRASNSSQEEIGEGGVAEEEAASLLIDGDQNVSIGHGVAADVKQEDYGQDAEGMQLAGSGAMQSAQPTFAAAAAGLEEIRRMNDTKQKTKSSKALEKEWVPKVRVEDLSGKQALLCKLLMSSEPVLAVHCPQNSGMSYRCAFREGARTPLVDLERACVNVYGRIDAGSTNASGGFDSNNTKDKDSNKGEWRMSSTTVEDAIEAANGELGAGRQYTLVRQMNWWGCNGCGQDVDETYESGFCCDVYKSMAASVPKSKRTTRRCRAVPHFVKNLELIEITEAGEERTRLMIIPPVDPATGKTIGIDAVNGSNSVLVSSVPAEPGALPAAPAWSPSREPQGDGERVGKRHLSLGSGAGGYSAPAAPVAGPAAKRSRSEQPRQPS